MIVVCERCDTRFQLDDARVPATGARVRCSRCKHAFLVLPPHADGDETVHAFAEAAAESAAPTPPGVTDDLSDPAPESSAAEEESEWQFAEHQRPAPSRPQKQDPTPDLWDSVLEHEKPPEALELDALGKPESWSFVSHDAPPLHPARTAPAPEAPAPTRAAAATPVGRVRLRAAEASPAPVEVVAEPSLPPRARWLDRAGWGLTGLLLLAIVHGIEWQGTPEAAPKARLPLQDGLVVEDLSLRRLENLVAGPVLVVAGALTNPGASPAGGPGHLRARISGGSARAEAEAAAPHPEEVLREASPELLANGAPLLGAALRPGAKVAFEAVLAPAPAGAARVELHWEPSVDAGEAPASGPDAGAGGASPATGDPSPPTPLPSSG